MNKLNETEQYFYDAMQQQGIPVTEEQLREKFDAMAEAEGLVFKNPGDASPFYRFLKKACITPVLWLLEYVVRVVMPSLYVKTAEKAALDLRGWVYDAERKNAVKTRGVVQLTRASTDTSVTVPAGRWIRTAPIDGQVYRVQTTESVGFDSGSLTTLVTVEAENTGSAYNLAPGYFTILEQPITGIVALSNPTGWITTAGADDESDDDFRLRIQAAFSAVSDHHVNSVYKNIIAQVAGISYDRIFIDNTAAPRGPGSADAYVLFDTGSATGAVLAPVNQFIRDDGNHGHGDDLMVKPMPESSHDISATLWVPAGMSADQKADIQQTAEQMIRAAFRENNEYPDVTRAWPYSRFSFQGLGGKIMTRRTSLRSIEWGQGDIVSTLDIPRINTLTIAVNEVA